MTISEGAPSNAHHVGSDQCSVTHVQDLLTLLVTQEATVRPVRLNTMSRISHPASICVPMSVTTRGMKCTWSLNALKKAMEAGL